MPQCVCGCWGFLQAGQCLLASGVKAQVTVAAQTGEASLPKREHSASASAAL
jgi:hypothetical protein